MSVGEEPNGDFLSEIDAGAARLPGDLVFGPEHRSVVSAMEEIFSAALAGTAPPYNPIVLHGGNGLGKTHLLRAMGEALRPVLGRNSVQYVRAAEYAQEMLEAIDADDISAWRGRYRDAQWFVLDDLEHLAGKPVAQDELTRTIDLLLTEGRQVAVISHGPVAKANGLIPSLVARLAGGLSVRMPMPERATRERVLTRLATAKLARFTEGAIERLAAGYEASPVVLGERLRSCRRSAGTPRSISRPSRRIWTNMGARGRSRCATSPWRPRGIIR